MFRVFLVVSILLAMFGAGYYVVGGSVNVGPVVMNSDSSRLRKRANQFWEDIQFKDFDAAAAHHENQLSEKIDIPFLIKRIFLVKPEVLEILDYEIVYARIDSTDRRARVKFVVNYKELVREKFGKREIMLYFYRANASGQWFLKLEDSLRKLTPDKGKIIG